MMVRFFSPEEETQIVAAIRRAEAMTSGEIRVHVEVGATAPALSVAKRVFTNWAWKKPKTATAS
jgi:hypothetical protein